MKRIRLATAVAATGALVLAACSGEDAGDDTAFDPDNPDAEVTLTITSTTGSNVDFFNWAAESFREEYPGVTVDVVTHDDDWYNQNAARLLNSDDRPDLAWFWLTGFYTSLVDSGALLPLDDLYEQEGWADVLPESTLNLPMAEDGQRYGVAFNSIMSPLLMYNRNALEAAGIDGEPETMEELLALGPQLEEAGYIPWTSGLANPSQATQLFDINIRRYTDDETYQQLIDKEIMDYTGPQMIAAFENMYAMANELMAPGAVGVEDLEARSLFAQGEAAFYSDGSWNLGEAGLGGEISDDVDLGIMTYPPATEGGNRTTGFYDANGLVVVRDTGNEELAKAFIAHALSYEVQSTMGEVITGTPVRNDIPLEVLEETYDPFVAYSYSRVQEEGTHRLFNTIMPGEYRPAATQLIQGLVGGQLTPEEFAQQFTDMVQGLDH
ncbi:ABC transporter substrate-binding protein [Ruania rhizosphaerae]|uniref:ABC transporter substrate-binding protein n=1 Tax=Ruania rhizosphaerae TaxID=1840413 RepID=UPI001357D683|nr:ABC transporter substrate-binding protein [Ruania rhizosphaerae]